MQHSSVFKLALLAMAAIVFIAAWNFVATPPVREVGRADAPGKERDNGGAPDTSERGRVELKAEPKLSKEEVAAVGKRSVSEIAMEIKAKLDAAAAETRTREQALKTYKQATELGTMAHRAEQLEADRAELKERTREANINAEIAVKGATLARNYFIEENEKELQRAKAETEKLVKLESQRQGFERIIFEGSLSDDFMQALEQFVPLCETASRLVSTRMSTKGITKDLDNRIMSAQAKVSQAAEALKEKLSAIDRILGRIEFSDYRAHVLSRPLNDRQQAAKLQTILHTERLLVSANIIQSVFDVHRFKDAMRMVDMMRARAESGRQPQGLESTATGDGKKRPRGI